MQKRGLFIVLEGLDRSGKSSQCKNILNFFAQKEMAAELINFPNRETQTGKMIDGYLKNSDTKLGDEVVHLLYSTNRWEMKEYILETINSGTHIVCDRYAYSGVAYTHAKGLDFDWCVAPDKGLPHPDLVLFVNTTAEEISKRAGFGDERYEKTEFQEKVYSAFIKMKDVEPHWHDIEGGSATIEEIESRITEKISETLESYSSGEDLPTNLFQ
ncbi:unnamed protein product [Moneuplotes crassus]|uniref:Thymidylate kinase n=1 Tax=Euplotes crassus TaxID=5936 RepID=A0AAD1Y022_EUPCR|nr:unnamed protein product [Moneuplotes crassus]